MREFTGDEGEEAKWDASGVKERDHRTMPPVINGEFGCLKMITIPTFM